MFLNEKSIQAEEISRNLNLESESSTILTRTSQSSSQSSIDLSTNKSTTSTNKILKAYHNKDVLASCTGFMSIHGKNLTTTITTSDQNISINSSSCINFLNQLVDEKKLTQLTTTATRDSQTLRKMFSASSTNMNNSNKLQRYSQEQHHEKLKQFYLISKKLRKQLPFNSGLKNHGNTCFMNCVLQCLFHTSPLCEYFITNHVDRDMQMINTQRLNNHFYTNSNQANQNNGSFVLTRHFHRLLISMWRNTYDTSFSAELKQLIGHLNPTFAGVNQNDSHEFCVWLLDKLSQELTIKSPQRPPPTSNNNTNGNRSDSDNDESENDSSFNYTNANRKSSSNNKPSASSSFVQDIVKVKFKSTVVCSKCQYKSSKYETDMMLSLPLPNQLNKSSPPVKQPVGVRPLRRSLYIRLILTSSYSIRTLTNTFGEALTSTSQFDNARFYVSDVDDGGIYHNTSNLSTPFYAKIAVNIHISSDENYARESLISGNNQNTVVNPSFGDLRRYIETSYQLTQSNLVFLDTDNIRETVHDSQSVKLYFLPKQHEENDVTTMTNGGLKFSNTNESITVVELNQIPKESQHPLINIIATNVYYQQQQSTNGSSNQPPPKKCFFYGVPFVLLINRDCTYSDLCKRILESQSKLLKDRNMLKYYHLAEKLFSISMCDTKTKLTLKINPADQLPLYAEFIDQALNESSMLAGAKKLLEHIKLNIEWRSLDDLSNLFREIDYSRAEFVHKSVKYLQTMDENESLQQQQQQYSESSETHSTTTNSNSMITLDDCFELFTQREELTDENSWMCPKCKKQTNAYKKLCISSVPPILIIHLKRFFYKSKTTNFKLTTPVWFPVSSLDMSKYLDKGEQQNNYDGENEDETNVGEREHHRIHHHHPHHNQDSVLNDKSSSANKSAASQTRPYVYDLFAVCNHKGQNMANGHYTAFCKNPVDTRWYCFDDSACMPIVDVSTNSSTSLSSIFSNGASSVCTENAYILFYKRRDCMKNERWWSPYIDRSLFSYDEFYSFFSCLDLIEREQQYYQQQQQIEFLNSRLRPASSSQYYPSTNQPNLYSYANGQKKSSSLKASIKNKLLGNSSSTSSNSRNSIHQTSDYAINEEDVNLYYETSDFVCQRELSKKLERERQDEILKTSSNRYNKIIMHHDLADQSPPPPPPPPPPPINTYDEYNRPSRLLKHQSTKKSPSSPYKQDSSSSQQSNQKNESPTSKSVSSVSSTSTTNNHRHHHLPSNNLKSAQITTAAYDDDELYPDDDYCLNRNLNFHEEFENKMKLNSGSSSNNNDLLLNYPNDNEYIYNQPSEFIEYNNSDGYNKYAPQKTLPNYVSLRNNYLTNASSGRTAFGQQQQPTTKPTNLNMNNNSNNNNNQQYSNPSLIRSNKSNNNNGDGTNAANTSLRYMNPSSIETPI